MKIYLMHQTHTDIGYTDRQEKITRYHVDYLKQAIGISEAIHAGKKEWEGFVWNNETFWILERFLEKTTPEWKERLLAAVKRGHIHLTGNYLNLTDLVDYRILKKYLMKARHFADKEDVRIDTAISMDINGWSAGYGDALAEAGIKHFYTCIHNHHGFVPFQKKHMPFYWETPSGKKILVWHGDVYNHGNLSRLVPDVRVVETKDGWAEEALISKEQLAHAKEWFDDYIGSLRTQGYTYDFLPVMTKGLLVDNAPPNAYIAESVKAFNEAYGEEMEIEMVGINDFFDILKEKDLDLETHKGDWNDWWSDGFASTPDALMAYREAQRKYHQLANIADKGEDIGEKRLHKLEYNLMMFSEHTWGYFTSVSEPWNKMTKKLEARNKLFAEKANELADTLLDDYQESKGEAAKMTGRPLLYKVENPYPQELESLAAFTINWWEEFLVKDGYEVIDKESKETITHQEIRIDEKKRREVNVRLRLAPFETRELLIVPKKAKRRKMPLDPLFTRDETYDYISPYIDNTVNATMYHLETPHIRLAWDKERGIHTFLDKKTDTNLVRKDDQDGLFTPIYETSEIEHTYKFEVPEMQSVRRAYGRNRKILSTLRDHGELINAKILEKGPLLARVQLKFLLAGTTHAVLELSAHRDEARLDVGLIIAKDTVWAPESLYMALPLTTGQKEELFIEKSGCILRPRIDQLEGSQALFYTLQSGYALRGAKRSIHVATPDAPLLHLGSLEPGFLCIHDHTLPNADRQYSWLMNNYWETNFATNLGGFYRFDYAIGLSDTKPDPESIMEKTRELNRRFLVYQGGRDA